MSNDRKIAGHTLQVAMRAVMVERADQHGSAEDSFAMIAALWDVYLQHSFIHKMEKSISGSDVAHMMTLLKIARSLYGNSSNNDHYADAAGYQALAAMLNNAGPVAAPEGEN
jgi:hypothetical protein